MDCCTLGLVGGISGGGGLVVSGRSILTIMSKAQDNNNNINNFHNNMSDEEASSSSPDDDELELGLGLSIGCGLMIKQEASKIFTTKDFSSFIPSSSSSSSSVNSSISGIAIDPAVSPHNLTSVVGWPPIRRAHRKPITANQNKSEHQDYNLSVVNNNKTSGYLSVKVNMDGTLIGRKVDLNAHNSYEMLALAVEDMFFARRSNIEAGGCSRLLNETSDFVLTYEDNDGDCMLVGDVPWQMFLNSVKRLRILKNPKSSGLAEQRFT